MHLNGFNMAPTLHCPFKFTCFKCKGSKFADLISYVLLYIINKEKSDQRIDQYWRGNRDARKFNTISWT